MTIKLNSLKADVTREATGDWVEYPDWPGVAFNVSSLHSPAYTTARDLELQRAARKYKKRLPPPEETAEIAGKIYAEHILHDWRGLDVAYSPDVALATLCDPAFRAVVEAVEWCAGQLGEINAEFAETAAKNSARPSATD